MLERDFSKIVKKWLDEQGIFYFKKPQGKFVNRKGIADYQLCIRGQYIALELKTNTGELSESQVKERAYVLKSKGWYFVGRPKNWEELSYFLTMEDINRPIVTAYKRREFSEIDT